jgi:septum formation protein
MAERQLILGSSSPWRRILLERLKVAFTCHSPDIDETPKLNESAYDLVLRLAIEKAEATAQQYPDALIIGSDQVGTLGEHILCKPLTYDNAVKQLANCNGQTVRFYTGVCVLDAKTKQVESTVATYDVIYQTYTQQDIENYLRKESALNCAGSLQAEGLGISLIKRFEGDDYTALIGLPLTKLVPMLKKLGFDVLAVIPESAAGTCPGSKHADQ